jgi:hypothetical protein
LDFSGLLFGKTGLLLDFSGLLLGKAGLLRNFSGLLFFQAGCIFRSKLRAGFLKNEARRGSECPVRGIKSRPRNEKNRSR